MSEMLSINLIIIIITCVVSYLAFSNRQMMEKMLFWPALLKDKDEWYRFLSSGFIHVDFGHLAVNMFVLYSFGSMVENVFGMLVGPMGKAVYLLFYLIAIAVSSVPDAFRNQNNHYFRSLGASGAVAAVMFASILFNPMGKITFVFFPFFGFPAIIIGVLYLFYSAYMAKRNTDNIGHLAHFSGAVFGFLFPLLLEPKLFQYFLQQIFG